MLKFWEIDTSASSGAIGSWDHFPRILNFHTHNFSRFLILNLQTKLFSQNHTHLDYQNQNTDAGLKHKKIFYHLIQKFEEESRILTSEVLTISCLSKTKSQSGNFLIFWVSNFLKFWRQKVTNLEIL